MLVDDDFEDQSASLAAAADALQHLSAVATKEYERTAAVGGDSVAAPGTSALPVVAGILGRYGAMQLASNAAVPLAHPPAAALSFVGDAAAATAPAYGRPRATVTVVTPEVISTAVGAVDLLNLRRPSASGLPAGHPPSLVSDDNDDRIFDERYTRVH